MKRPATDSDMDLSSPTAKKLCLENPQVDVPDAVIPIDDLDDADDLYGESPVIIDQQKQSASKSPVHNAPPPQPSSLQYQHIQLPGLGLYQRDISAPENPLISDAEAARSYDSRPKHLNNELQTATQNANFLQPKEVEANGTSKPWENTPGEQSGNIEEPRVSVPTLVEADRGQETLDPTVSSSGTSEVRPDGVRTTEGNIRDGLVGQDGKDEHNCANDDGQSLGFNGFTKTDESAIGVVTDFNRSPSRPGGLKNRVPATAHISEERKRPTMDRAMDHSATTNVATPGPEQRPSTPLASMEPKREGIDVLLMEEEQSKEMRNTVPDSVQQPLGFSERTKQHINGIEKRVLESPQVEPFKDSEALVGPKQQPSGPSKSIEPETEGTDAKASEQEESKEIADAALERVQQSLGSPKATERQINGTEDQTFETHGSELSKASPAPVPEGAQTSEETVEANGNDDEAEFEIDSSPIQSSSDSDSDSSTSSSEGSDYKMLDPEEEARRLMQEDGGSEDEGKGSKAASGPLRTLNEKPDEIVPKPQIEVTAAMAIAELGAVEHVVENSILIKAKVSGERQALENGSLLCLQDRSVIGVIAETLGQVRQPYYAVRFTNATAIAEAGLSKGTSVFYVEQHARYIFTQNLKALKGSDASNIHDEEVGDDELEFSDDEAEAEHKRKLKQARQSKRGGRADRGDGFARGPGATRVRRGGRFNQADDRVVERLPERPPISYDEQDDGEDLYTPLARPINLHEAMGHREAPQEHLSHRLNIVGNGQEPRRGRPDRGRGRGDRGRGSGGARGDRKGGGGFSRDHRNAEHHYQHQQYQAFAQPSPQSTGQEPSFPPNGHAYQPTPSHGWPTSYAPDQYNHPSYNAAYHQSTPFLQQPPYGNQDASHYPQPPVLQQYSNANLFPYRQSSPPVPNGQYPPHRAASPTTLVPPNIPAGAHINPAFFPPTSQQRTTPQIWQQQQQQPQNTYGSPPVTGRGRSPQSETAFLAAQEKLNLLRQLSRNGGSPT
ncbi:MAG: hypothetical protein Q9196_004068 [Gyalolechia fulgens]